ncbi:YdcF family protein [Chryseobacterium sp. WG14]|uniref:SanA/YdcF family protein n=1 Tax=unclassified Chryseobacterium TaxID=2593645 RepID=UPI00211E8DB8|nr:MULTISPECIES: ElyC/SanA/YdcF family protein [unclassified Chryseobacterium]MCQ9634650.1 YdcF family protein [Chryseobacterium sp. WG23]MCQ9640626.1 YdcF family protein [Chryseobacterium sp. WG14]
MQKIIKNIFKIFLLLFVAGIIFIAWANYSIKKENEAFLFYSTKDVPQAKTALLLGTGKTLSNGMPNAYFYNRIKAATDLYKSGKIQYIIVSGDNSTKDYNEPEDMLLTLMQQGIPQDKIIMDHAGFRTLDSVVRAKEIFGQTKLVIISQKFHNERAVFLARKNGMEAFGYNAADVNKYAGLKTNMREYLAKAKVYWDLIFGVEPKFGGEKIIIP